MLFKSKREKKNFIKTYKDYCQDALVVNMDTTELHSLSTYEEGEIDSIINNENLFLLYCK